MARRNPAETPLMRQFLDVKADHPDAIVFFRLGDFYEMFFEDAVVAARALDLTLTTRDKGREDAIPMCGVPHHSARAYVARLTDLGHKVVVCEQVEDPRLAKGLVKREVVRVITPGVVLDDEVLDPKLPRYLAALVPAATKGNPQVGLAYLDATTGELFATELQVSSVLDELVRVAPREVLAEPAQLTGMLAPIQRRYQAAWNAASVPASDAARAELGALGACDSELATRAAATVVAYARATQPAGTLPIARLVGY